MTYHVTRRLFHTEGKDRLVFEDDPQARFLAFPAGTELADEEARRLGVAEFERKMATPSQDKMARPPRNKLGPRPADKSTEENQ